MAAPTANAGSDQTTTTGQVLFLSATYSAGSAPIKDIRWTQVSGPDCTMTYPSKAITPVYELSSGTYVFQFAANDTANASTTDTVQITVSSSGGPLYIPQPFYPYNTL